MDRPFKVIIVGGGIAGLTLANSLQHGNIEYVLLEARLELAPQLGASIGLGPNGSRILDQLGCYEDIMGLTVPIEYTGSHRPNGTLMRSRTDAFQLVQARANYCMCFLDRQAVLRVLANHIFEPRRILLNKRVQQVLHRPEGVTVACDDGTLYEGDVVVGADGAYSRVRSEMWRIASEESPNSIPKQEQENMTAEYRCLFGISPPQEGLPSRTFDTTYIKDLTPIVITGKDERVYWFLIERMPEKCHFGHIPRFSREQAEEFAVQHLDVPLAPNGKVRFRQLWETHETCTLLALEEAYFEHWTWGRFACLGDSVHKMTPNMGAGGNSAIESAAELANSLHELEVQARRQRPSLSDVRSRLLKYQSIRNARASSTVRASSYITRLHAVRTIVEKIMAYYVLPKAGDFLVDMASLSWIGATRIDYLDIPLRSLDGTMPFNPEQGIGRSESFLRRMLGASPLLALAFFHLHVLERYVPHRSIARAVSAGELVLGRAKIPLYKGFYGIPFIDRLWKGIVTLFLPSITGNDLPSSFQLSTSLADFGTVYSIILIESARRANLLSPMRVPLLFGLATQLLGAGTAMPVYYFLYIAMVPISAFRASDLRLTDLSYTRSVLPIMTCGYYVPYLLSLFGPNKRIRHAAVWIFQMSPVWVSLGHWVLARLVFRSTIARDRIYNVNRDVNVIRWSLAPMILCSAISWIRTLSMAPLPLWHVLWPPGDNGGDFIAKAQNVLRNDQIFFSAGSLLWMLYLFKDLKRAGMVQFGWFGVIWRLALSTACVGPGATVGVAWLFREHFLATRRHKGAVVSREDKTRRESAGSDVDTHSLASPHADSR